MPTLHPRRAAVGSAAVIIAASLALTACGGEPSPTSEVAQTTLTFGVQAAPNSLDPAQLHDGQQRYVWGAVYDTLIYSDNEGVLKPGAAKSWEYSADAKSLTLKLRDDMEFSDGDPVTSAAVKTSLERTRTTAGPQQSNLSAIASIDTPDEHTAVLNLKRQDPDLLVSLSYGAGAIGDPGTINEARTALDPVGSGPYTLDRTATVDGTKYVLNRRDDYWNAKAYPFKTVTVRVIPDRTALFNALLTNELDAGTVDAAQAKQIEANGFSLTPVEDVSTAAIVIADRAGQVAPPLADVRVRQAINYAFDRKKMLNALVGGNGRPIEQVFNKLSPAYSEELDNAYSFDPGKARTLLKEAGYPSGFTLAMPANAIVQQFQASITQALADIGIKVDWEPVPAQSSSQTTKWGMYFNLGTTAAPSRTTSLYFGKNGSQNPFRYEDPKMNDLLAKLAGEADPTRAGEIYKEINKYATDNAWIAPLFSLKSTWAMKKGLEYRGTGSAVPDLRVFGVTGK
ncbi:peptide/nickel transport system substrate-binding protein [Pseudarthrobacter siccitolerans]|uniref:Peptide/nickel transport system substrate-binding protein n=1 Tax=Pseudarthrobacter siccitolerans TaxID=861266 RepID=A0ABU0PMA5_9MICC|nr:ABC transporter substrate-binding protein [Pseudarthrobacter siccitolerans]MDQ0675102.1 peptide/nickel transport system substrate-binding protein [Pseudarthrobacter siccitolerans]